MRVFSNASLRGKQGAAFKAVFEKLFSGKQFGLQ